MITGQVVGVCVATRKDPTLQGRKLLMVQPINSAGVATGQLAIAVDCVGAGAGETVMLAKSREASMAAGDAPVDLAVVGIVDTLTATSHQPPDLSAWGFHVAVEGEEAHAASPGQGSSRSNGKAGRVRGRKAADR